MVSCYLNNHPNICKFFEKYESTHNFFIVMEYIKGGNIWDRIENINTYKLKNFNMHDIAQLIIKMMKLLMYLEKKGIIH